jgi:precorrin-8X/cobalt-precorrin-8 methylmutase
MCPPINLVMTDEKARKKPMNINYETDPRAIERESFRQIRLLAELENFDETQQQVVMRIVHSLGMPEVAGEVRFSEHACARGMLALQRDCSILCDVEMVKAGVTKRLIKQRPVCFLNDNRVPEMARVNGETRSMAAIELWQPLLAESVVLIGNAPTALFRLLEILQSSKTRPALIIAMPVGFVGAAESKQLLWDSHRELGVECITLSGRQGGSAVTSASCNALLRCNAGEWY